MKGVYKGSQEYDEMKAGKWRLNTPGRKVARRLFKKWWFAFPPGSKNHREMFRDIERAVNRVARGGVVNG